MNLPPQSPPFRHPRGRVIAPFLFPDYTNEIAVLWLMIVFASTWDMLGGQMGYNSLGNIFFFGAGMYICAIVQIGLYYDVDMYTSGARTTHIVFTNAQYFTGFASARSWPASAPRCSPSSPAGSCSACAGPISPSARWASPSPRPNRRVMGMGRRRERHLDAGVARRARHAKVFFYFLLFALAFALLLFLRWLYSTNFGLALNAIRDDEEKAEAMGLHTKRYKRTAWAISAILLGIAGAIFGNMTGFIEPRDIAFPTTTFNIFMVLMVLLGGKGTLWGPVIGAVIFHVIKEVTWTYFLGWQFIALGLLIIVTIVYFQQGIVGWLMEKYPSWFAPRSTAQGAEEPPRSPLAPHPEGAE